LCRACQSAEWPAFGRASRRYNGLHLKRRRHRSHRVTGGGLERPDTALTLSLGL
jgi:hypothetical protein